MHLTVTHQTTYTYEPSAERLAFRLRLFPAAFEGQQVGEWAVKVNGETVPRLLLDGAGDGVGLWHAREPQSEVVIVASGEVDTQDRSGIVSGLQRRPPAAMYLRETPLTVPDTAVRELARSAQHDELLDTLHALSAAVTKAVAYKPGVTTTTTTAADAVRIGAGVCQDHAHVFVSAARSLGVPARYVVGYLLADEDGNEVVETHAWAEAFCRDVGWIGFDASNAVSPTERYIRLGCGHDAAAATPIRGTLTGDAIGSLSAKVSITPAAAQQSQQQSQSGV